MPRVVGRATELGWGLGFASLLLGSSFLLQRFAIPVGTFKVSLATPLVLGVMGWGLLSGRLGLDRGRLAAFCGLLVCVLAALALRLNTPAPIAPRDSLPSMIHWLALTSLAVCSFAEPVDEAAFMKRVSTWLCAISVAGIAQFFLQFVMPVPFAFKGMVPEAFLIEEFYALELQLGGIGGRMRANGFFLVEPSVFSQFAALGIAIELVSRRNPLRLALLFGGLVTSVSGTGWMVLAASVAATSLRGGGRGLAVAVGAALAGAAAIGILAVLSPEIAAIMLGRTAEFWLPGTSGHERFVTPFLALGDVVASYPVALLAGVGPGTGEYLSLAYKYGMNTPVKVVIEYGVPALLFFLFVVFGGRGRTASQVALLPPLVVLLMFTGGYHQFAPVLFPVLLIGVVARLRDDGRR